MVSEVYHKLSFALAEVARQKANQEYQPLTNVAKGLPCGCYCMDHVMLSPYKNSQGLFPSTAQQGLG